MFCSNNLLTETPRGRITKILFSLAITRGREW